MSEMLKSIKADLLSRQMLPVLIVVCAALVAAVGYGVLGGSHKSAPKVAGAPVQVPNVPGPAVSSAPANPNSALAETTAGASFQHAGAMRNPFAPLPGSVQSGSGSSVAGPTVTTVQGNGTASITTGTGTGTEGSGSSSQGGSSGAGTPSGSAPSGSEPSGTQPTAGPVTVYRVSATLQQISAAGKPLGKPRSFKDIRTLTPLPGSHDPLLSPYVAGKEGKSIIFMLLRAPILHGGATCLPSAEDCLAIEVPLHGSEELRYLSSNGQVTAYRLKVTAIHSLTISLSAQKAQEAQRKGLSIIRRRVARLREALATTSSAKRHR